MAEYRESVVTDLGMMLVNKQLAGGKTFKFTRMTAGAGAYTQQELQELHLRTELKEKIKSYELTKIEQNTVSGEVQVSSVFGNTGLETQVLINEIGLYAEDEAQEILYSITTAIHPLQLPKYNDNYEHKINIDMICAVSNGLKITVKSRTDIASDIVAGAVKASEDILVREDGKMELATDFEEQLELSQLKGTEKRNVFLGKIAKAVKEFILHKTLAATNTLAGHVKLAYHEDITEPGTHALDAVQANARVRGTIAHQMLQHDVDLSNKVPINKISSSSAVTEASMYVLDAREKNASLYGTMASQIAELNTNLAGKASSVHNHDDRYYTAGAVDNALATLWGDSKITVGSTTANMNPSEFSGVAASWSKIGKLVILRYACERTKSGVSTTFVVSGIPPATNREEILWYNEAKGARGYLEGGNISLYAYGSTTGGYYRGETVYISQY